MLHDASHQVLLKIIYRLEVVKKFQDRCLVHDHRLYLRGMKVAFLGLIR